MWLRRRSVALLGPRFSHALAAPARSRPALLAPASVSGIGCRAASTSSSSTGPSRQSLALLAGVGAAALGVSSWLLLGRGSEPPPPPPAAGADDDVVAAAADDNAYIEETTLTRTQLEARYTMEKRIGQGGFGDVWLARDTRTGRRVAIKILPLERLPRKMVEQEVTCFNVFQATPPGLSDPRIPLLSPLLSSCRE